MGFYICIGMFFPSPTTGQLVVARGPNCRDTTKSSLFTMNIQNGSVVEVTQPPGGSLEVYSLSGGGEIADGSFATITLSGQQILVNYKLYCNDVLLDRAILSDYKFSRLSTYGRYRVKAEQDGQEVWMTG